MEKDELMKYYHFFTDVWKLFKKFHEPKSDEEWQELIDEADNLAKRYKGKNFEKIILATTFEIERLDKERRKKNERTNSRGRI